MSKSSNKQKAECLIIFQRQLKREVINERKREYFEQTDAEQKAASIVWRKDKTGREIKYGSI